MILDVTIFGAKTAIVLVILFLSFRVLGKRQTGQLNIYDLAMIMALANAVQNAMTAGRGDIWVGLASSTSLLVVGWALTRLFLRSRRAERFLIGTPTVILNRGKVLKHRLRREHVTIEELLSAIRQHGLQSPEQVRMAVLEVDGTISIIPISHSGS